MTTVHQPERLSEGIMKRRSSTGFRSSSSHPSVDEGEDSGPPAQIPVSLVLTRTTADLTKNDEEKLLEPFGYYRNSHPGKGRRKGLFMGFNHHLKLPEDWIAGVASIIEDLHTASLLIDDIEDNSPLRRGAPAAHVAYGLASTINSGNYVYFIAMSKVAKLAEDFGANTGTIVTAFVEEMLELHRGQGMEIWWRDHQECPTLDEYALMAERKTGGLLRLGVRLIQCHPQSPVHLDLTQIAEEIGRLYQVRDDFINLASASYSSEKGFAEDISEGKYSFPIIHSLSVAPDSGLADILRQKPESLPLKKTAVALVRQTKSLDFTVAFLKQLEERLLNRFAALGGNPGLESFVSELGRARLDYEHDCMSSATA